MEARYVKLSLRIVTIKRHTYHKIGKAFPYIQCGIYMIVMEFVDGQKLWL
jgi:hypothetical protein